MTGHNSRTVKSACTFNRICCHHYICSVTKNRHSVIEASKKCYGWICSINFGICI